MQNNKPLFFIFKKDWFDQDSIEKEYEFHDQSYTEFVDSLVEKFGIDLQAKDVYETTSALIQYPAGGQTMLPDVMKIRSTHTVISDFDSRVYRHKYVVSILNKVETPSSQYYEGIEYMKNHPAYEEIGALLLLVGEVDDSGEQCKTC